MKRFVIAGVGLLCLVSFISFTPERVVEMMAHYPLGSDALDATGNFDPMILENTPFQDGGIYSNGVFGSTRAVTPELETFNFESFAITAQFKVFEKRTGPVFMGGTSSGWIAFYLVADGSVSMKYNNNNFVGSSTSYTLGEWHRATIAYDGAVGSLYLDGDLVASDTFEINHLNDANIGISDFSVGISFKGLFRNLRIYDTPLIDAVFVEGAEEDLANGVYYRFEQDIYRIHWDKNYYIKQNNSCGGDGIPCIEWTPDNSGSNKRWVIADTFGSSETFFLNQTDCGFQPPATGWKLGEMGGEFIPMVCGDVCPGAPQAKFMAEFDPLDKLTYTFTDNSLDCDEIVAWEWDLGDGTTSNERQVVHTYAEKGMRPVSLSVTDAEGLTGSISDNIPVDIERVEELPDEYELDIPYPNPFTSSTRFSLRVPTMQDVQVDVFDMQGRKISTLFDGLIAPGAKTWFVFEAGSLTSGQYMIRVIVENQLYTTREVTLVR